MIILDNRHNISNDLDNHPIFFLSFNAFKMLTNVQKKFNLPVHNDLWIEEQNSGKPAKWMYKRRVHENDIFWYCFPSSSILGSEVFDGD